MCLAYPMKIQSLDAGMAVVSAGSVKARASVHLLDKPKKGEYVLVHAGIAIEKIQPVRAREMIKIFKSL